MVKGLKAYTGRWQWAAQEGSQTGTAHQNCTLEGMMKAGEGGEEGKAWRQLGSLQISLERLSEGMKGHVRGIWDSHSLIHWVPIMCPVLGEFPGQGY